MNHWIFQGNPDVFDVDEYLRRQNEIIWSVRQEHLAKHMRPGDDVFIWKAAGIKKQVSGVVAFGHLTDSPGQIPDDGGSRDLWRKDDVSKSDLRVPIQLELKRLSPKEVVRRDWLAGDPVASGMRILRMANETNYRITDAEASRLRALVRNTGRDWNREECVAGLWAYAHTKGGGVSKKAESTVAKVAVAVGRAVTGVYNKVMNFRSLDPTEPGEGLSSVGQMDKRVWADYFDTDSKLIDVAKLDRDYEEYWGAAADAPKTRDSYKDFGDAPNDDITELMQFALKVRRGQPSFRRNLLRAYDERCAITGQGPADVLEAVHIVPHAESGINELDNGLLLRSDLHCLLDAGLLGINPDTLAVEIDKRLAKTPYVEIHGKPLRKRADGTQMGTKYVRERWATSKDPQK